jgi:hypothetical protein
MRYKSELKRQKEAAKQKGSGLIVVILVMAFLVTVGVALITVTSIGSRVTGNVRAQQEAFNAAEAGFDVSWIAVEDYFLNHAWTSFDGRYLTEPAGIDIPLDVNYFRYFTDQELLNILDQDGDGNPDYNNVIFFKQEFISVAGGGTDPRYTYTAFLIDDEAAGGMPNHGDALLICIGTAGTGPRMSTSRLEILLAVEQN